MERRDQITRKERIELRLLQLYFQISSPPVVGAMVGFIVGWALVAPYLVPIMLVPHILIVLLSGVVGYHVGVAIDRRMHSPWHHLIPDPPMSPEAPLFILHSLKRQDDADENFVIQHPVTRKQGRSLLDVSSEYMPLSETTCLSHEKALVSHRLLSIPQDWHVNLRRLQQLPLGGVLREGKAIGSLISFEVVSSSDSNAAEDIEEIIRQTLPHVRLKGVSSSEVIYMMIENDVR